jgi:hypothetical protein
MLSKADPLIYESVRRGHVVNGALNFEPFFTEHESLVAQFHQSYLQEIAPFLK